MNLHTDTQLESINPAQQQQSQQPQSQSELEHDHAQQQMQVGYQNEIMCCPIPECGKMFKKQTSLQRHTRMTHGGEKPFACDFEGCNRSFSG